jgi:hypothetical protein
MPARLVGSWLGDIRHAAGFSQSKRQSNRKPADAQKESLPENRAYGEPEDKNSQDEDRRLATVGCEQMEKGAITPGGTRTPNLWFRRPLLYPVELRARLDRAYPSNPAWQGIVVHRVACAFLRTIR